MILINFLNSVTLKFFENSGQDGFNFTKLIYKKSYRTFLRRRKKCEK